MDFQYQFAILSVINAQKLSYDTKGQLDTVLQKLNITLVLKGGGTF